MAHFKEKHCNEKKENQKKTAKIYEQVSLNRRHVIFQSWLNEPITKKPITLCNDTNENSKFGAYFKCTIDVMGVNIHLLRIHCRIKYNMTDGKICLGRFCGSN